MTIKKAPSLERIRELFDYHEDGYFIRKIAISSKSKVGDIVNWKPDTNGYRHCRIDNETYYLHRLIYYLHTEEWPPEIDHRDGNKANNKIENLRASNRSHNQHSSGIRKDNILGLRNISPHKQSGGYQVIISQKGILKSKYCKTLNEALITRNDLLNELNLENERRI